MEDVIVTLEICQRSHSRNDDCKGQGRHLFIRIQYILFMKHQFLNLNTKSRTFQKNKIIRFQTNTHKMLLQKKPTPKILLTIFKTQNLQNPTPISTYNQKQKNPQQQKYMKYLTFFITLFAYTSLHIMRMSIPFVQLKLMQFFAIDKFHMGIANGGMYIVIGLSYLWHALYPIKNGQVSYLWSITISDLCYLIIPLCVFLNARIPALLYIGLAGFGWFQTVAWPVLLAIVHTYFSPKKEGCMLGLWSANGDVGNIIGFMMCTVVVYTFHLPFQFCLVIAAIISILMIPSVYSLKIDETETTKKHLLQQKLKNQPNICEHYKQIIKQPLIIFMLIMMCLLKGILYGILLWLPMYFDKSGFKQFEGIIPIAMNIAAILGSMVLGLVYQKIHKKVLRATIFMLTLIITCICFYLLQHIQFTVQNKLISLIIISIIGFCIMGNFNIISAHEVTQICDRLGYQITAFSSLVMSLCTTFVGIVQIIIGRFATDDSNSVFVIFFVMGIVLIVVQVVRIGYLYYSGQHGVDHHGEKDHEHEHGNQKQVQSVEED